MPPRKPPETTMGAATPQTAAPAEEAAKADAPKDAPKTPKAIKAAAVALCEVLNGAGVLDPEKKYGADFDAFHKAAKSSDEDYQGLDVGIMNEDVSKSVVYAKRIKSRRYWAAKLAAL